MNIPQFTAQSSLYRTSNRYRSSIADFGSSIMDQSIVPSYIPGAMTRSKCSGCTEGCAITWDICLAKTAVEVTEACWASLGFGCGAAIALGYIQTGACYESYAACMGICNIPGNPVWRNVPCCPKVCRWFEDPFTPGAGCCDYGEGCVAEDDPNSRQGCCPSDQRVCGGNCCAKGESCCGDTCCPPGYYCLDGNFCSEYPATIPFGNPPPPPPPVNNCAFGGAPCGPTCCPPGLQCCGYTAQFGADCRKSCFR